MRKMRKKFLLTFIIAFLLIAVTGCGTNDLDNSESNNTDTNRETIDLNELTFNISKDFGASKFNQDDRKRYSFDDEDNNYICCIITTYLEWDGTSTIDDYYKKEYETLNSLYMEKVTYNGIEWTKSTYEEDQFYEYMHIMKLNNYIYKFTMADYSKKTNPICDKEFETVMNSTKLK